MNLRSIQPRAAAAVAALAVGAILVVPCANAGIRGQCGERGRRDRLHDEGGVQPVEGLRVGCEELRACDRPGDRPRNRRSRSRKR